MVPNDSGETHSLWMATQDIPAPPALTQDTAADVCVIGAGISGMTAAYLLAKEGNSVVVLEDGPIGGGATARTTAHISPSLDDGYHEYARIRGAKAARLAAESALAALDAIERTVAVEAIDCAFERVDGYLFLAPGHSPKLLDRELSAAHAAGLTDVQRLAQAPLDFFDTGQCLRFPRQGQFHPLRYLAGLEQAIARHGGRIHTHTHAEHIRKHGNTVEVSTQNGASVRAGAVVVATNSPISERVGVHAKQAPYRTYVVAARIPQGSVPKALYWDTEDPYHYARIHDGAAEGWAYDVLLVGGADHRTGEEGIAYEDRFHQLQEWTRERFPMVEAWEYRWSGQVLEPVDGLPFIGRDPAYGEGVYVITGDSGDGMINGTLGAMLTADLIMGRQNAWADLYDPARKPLRALNRLVATNLEAIRHYGEHVTPGEVESVEDIPRGSGAIVREGLRKLAVHRDAQGNLHKRSAVCTHMQCIVHWNEAEKTWDCPCHGSRFDPQGKVLNGPANQPLAAAE